MSVSHIWYKGIVHSWSDFAPTPRGILARAGGRETLLAPMGGGAGCCSCALVCAHSWSTLCDP